MNELTTVHLDIEKTGLQGLENVSEAEFFEYGVRLGKAIKGMQWALGDWYNNIPWGDQESACEKVDIPYSTASKAGAVAKIFPNLPDRQKLNYTRYVELSHGDINNDDRMRLLSDASKYDWSASDFKSHLNIAKGVIPPTPVEGFQGEVDKLGDMIADALPKTAGNKAKNMAKAGINKLGDKLKEGYNDAVDKKVAEDVKVIRENLKDAQSKAKEEFDRTIKMQAGVKAFMDKDEFSLIRSCLHPDKNSNPKAGEAFKIFNRLADVKNW